MKAHDLSTQQQNSYLRHFLTLVTTINVLSSEELFVNLGTDLDM